ncbi:MAG: bifunctional precorrin-2 dehydrogenase/sirohydrochlorin ferrochelatase [Deltaproteobacteria bacterium]|nr:bifunctional precorrin-2 dehydrogenase/sirohydrochlorin ferrochelatase [Deltaproteobacteria bacterium]
MKTYPMFALIDGAPVLVVGGGAVGERKVLDLLEAGALVTVASPEVTPLLARLADQGAIRHLPQEFYPELVAGSALVVGATDDARVNAAISAAARQRGIFVNIVDQPDLCTFIVPAQVKRGGLTIAVSTGGASPALARKIRERLEEVFGPEYGPYLELLQRVRERLLAVRRGHPDNARLFKRLVDSPLQPALSRGDREGLLHLLREVCGDVLDIDTLRDLVERVVEQ